MISRDELLVQAAKFDLGEADVQRDYLFGWIISGIFRESSLADRATLKIDETSKGTATGAITVTGIMLRVTTTTSKPRWPLTLATPAQRFPHSGLCEGVAVLQVSGCVYRLPREGVAGAGLAVRSPASSRGVFWVTYVW